MPRTGPAFRATANQAALFVLDRVGERASLSANTAAALELTGPLDADLFCRVLQQVLSHVETVHTRYFLKDGEVWAHALLERLQPIERTDLSDLPEAEAIAALDDILRGVGQRRFDLVDGPVFRAHLIALGGERHALVMATHHITFDGVSAGLFLGELASAYEQATRDAPSRTLAADPPFTPFSEVARAEHAARAAGAFTPAREEWTRYLEGLGEFARLPGCAPATLRAAAAPREAPLARERLFRLELPGGPDDTWDSVARGLGVTPVTLALTAIALAWRLHTRVDDVAFFCTYANRKSAPAALGYLVNTLPLRLRCTPSATLAELAQQVRVGMKLAQRFADVPGAFVLQECLPPGLEPPFPFLNLIVNSPLFDPHEFPPFSLGPVAMTVNPRSPVIPPGGDVAVNVTFSGRTAAFHCIAHPFDASAGGDEAAFELLCRHLGTALTAIAADPARPLARVDWFAPGEADLVTRRFPPGAALAGDAATSDDSLALGAGPDHPLVEGSDGRWSRSEVAGAAADFAARPRGAEAVVAVAGNNSSASVAAILALWDAGCPWVFVPADAAPATREATVERCGAKAVVGEPGALPLEVWPLVRPPPGRANAARPAPPDERLAYVVQTSGTTGTPVAVAIERSSVRAQVRALRQAWPFTAQRGQRFLLTARLSFDASLEALFLAVATGGTVVVPDAATLTTRERFWGFVRTARIDVLSLTPSFAAAMGPPREALEGVRAVILGGEELSAGLAAGLRQRLPRAVVLNTYGPTEATINTTFHDTADGRVVLGRPLPGFRCVVLDAERRPAPLGVRGELAISGPCLARGYLGDDEATARRFVTLPGGERAFLSGDEVSWTVDGQLEFHGRRDAQVKIRGHRVDRTEVEQALRGFPGVRDCTVVALRRGGRASLAALVQPREGASVDPAELRRSLSEVLPSSHVPEHLFVVATLWHSPSGKVDGERAAREALALLSAERLSAALTPAQARLCELWRQVLGTVPSLDEDLLESGLDSLAVISLCAAAQHQGLALAPEELFELRTLRRLAEATGSSRVARAVSPSLPRVEVASAPRVGLGGDGAQGVLLTGATGFLGIHVLDALLQVTRGELLCLVRADGAAEATARLAQAWAHFFPGQSLPARVRALRGDVGSEQLALPTGEYRQLAVRAGAVVHCAGDVRWLGEARQLERANVAGVRHVAALCLDARAPLHHVSTISLAFEGTQLLPYVASKAAGEQVLRALPDLDFAIYRVGMLVGRDRDGRFQRNAADSGLRLLLASVVLAAAKDASPCVTAITPVDACARALVSLARAGVPRASTLNVFAPQAVEPRWLAGTDWLAGGERSALEQLASFLDLRTVRRVLDAPETGRASELLAAQGFEWPEATAEAVTRWLAELAPRR